MGLRGKVNWNAIDKAIAEFETQYNEEAIEWLSYLGEQCVIVAKSLNTYQDQTANLRNSIGYIIVANGNIVTSKFTVDYRGSEFSTQTLMGEQVGELYAKSLAEGFTKGYTLIVVAGMDYASYVEDVHMLDVLKPAKDYAQNEIDNIVSNIIDSFKK